MVKNHIIICKECQLRINGVSDAKANEIIAAHNHDNIDYFNYDDASVLEAFLKDYRATSLQ